MGSSQGKERPERQAVRVYQIFWWGLYAYLFIYLWFLHPVINYTCMHKREFTLLTFKNRTSYI
jgi:hypothetical protein